MQQLIYNPAGAQISMFHCVCARAEKREHDQNLTEASPQIFGVLGFNSMDWGIPTFFARHFIARVGGREHICGDALESINVRRREIRCQKERSEERRVGKECRYRGRTEAK